MLTNKYIVHFDVFVSLTVSRCSQASPQLIQIFHRALWREDTTISLTLADESGKGCKILSLFTGTLQGTSKIN